MMALPAEIFTRELVGETASPSKTPFGHIPDRQSAKSAAEYSRVSPSTLLKNIDFSYPPKKYGENCEHPYITVGDAISDLPSDSITDGENYPSQPLSDYQRLMRKGSKGVYNHDITIHTDKTQEIIAMVPDGGNYKDLPLELQQTRKVHIAWTRLNSKRPSITIDTGHFHHFHYEYNRVPTVRESARIQSFPDTFHFIGLKTSQLKQVGNAVPPLMAKAIAEQLKNYL